MRKKPLQRVIQRYSDQVVNPAAKSYTSEGHRRAVAMQAAWDFAATAIQAKAYKNPLSVAHDMAEFTKAAPRSMPALLDRMDLELIAVDALLMARAEGGKQ